MLAITIQQPWAWAVVHGGKNVENRTEFRRWKRAVGQTVAIHAGQRWSERGCDDERVLRAYAAWLGVEPPAIEHSLYGWRGVGPIEPGYDRDEELLVRGAVIGLVYVKAIHQSLTDCCVPWGDRSYIEHGGRWRVDVVHLVLEDPRPVAPVECRGMLGLWTLPPEVAGELQAVSR